MRRPQTDLCLDVSLGDPSYSLGMTRECYHPTAPSPRWLGARLPPYRLTARLLAPAIRLSARRLASSTIPFALLSDSWRT